MEKESTKDNSSVYVKHVIEIVVDSKDQIDGGENKYQIKYFSYNQRGKVREVTLLFGENTRINLDYELLLEICNTHKWK